MVSGNIGLCDLRIRIAIAALAILSLVDLASAEPYEEWNKSFWEMGATTSFHDIRQTSDGGYIAVGVIQTGEIVEGTAWVMKMDERGNEQWNRTFGDKMTYDIFLSVQQTTDGGYIIAGYTNSYFPQFYPWILKMDADGNEQWNKTFRDKIPGSAHFVQQTKDGGYIIAGEKSPNSGGSNSDVLLIKTDENGNELWSKIFDGRSDSNNPIFIGPTLDGGYFMAVKKSQASGGSGNRVWLIKIDSNGNMKWDRIIIEENDTSWFTSALKVTDGYVLLGSTESYIENHTENSIYHLDNWLMKTDENGDEQWKRTVGERGLTSSLQMTEDGGFIIAGDKYPINKDIWVVKTWLIKTDGNGNVIWDETFGEGRTQKSVQTSDGGYIILSGKSYHIESEPFGRGYAWLIKVGEKAVPASVASQANQGEIPVSIPKEKLDGFEAVFSIAIILAACIAGRKMK